MVKERRHQPYTKFKAYLVENGLKQTDIAKLLNKSVSAFNQNLNGTGGDFNLSELRLLSRELGISIDEFFVNQKVSNMKLKVGECSERIKNN